MEFVLFERLYRAGPLLYLQDSLSHLAEALAESTATLIWAQLASHSMAPSSLRQGEL